MASRCWYTVKTKPQKEFYARDQFLNQGFEVYLPLTLLRRSHARKVEWATSPYFPGYLFLHLFNDYTPWTIIRSTYGAIGAVHFGDLYPPVPDEIIYSLKSYENEDGLILLPSNPESPFKKGERVMIIDGAFRDYEGIFLQREGKERVVVLLEMLKRQVHVRMKIDSLKSV